MLKQRKTHELVNSTVVDKANTLHVCGMTLKINLTGTTLSEDLRRLDHHLQSLLEVNLTQIWLHWVHCVNLAADLCRHYSLIHFAHYQGMTFNNYICRLTNYCQPLSSTFTPWQIKIWLYLQMQRHAQAIRRRIWIGRHGHIYLSFSTSNTFIILMLVRQDNNNKNNNNLIKRNLQVIQLQLAFTYNLGTQLIRWDYWASFNLTVHVHIFWGQSLQILACYQVSTKQNPFKNNLMQHLLITSSPSDENPFAIWSAVLPVSISLVNTVQLT